jgi:aspartyl-tRNA(Asn)/glutamyl-tRNA(Gln) amidotransferase subunit A
VLVGKAHLPEFAWSTIGMNPWYGTCHNPVRPGLTTGGSSSGNAAALAAGMADLGLGSDTGCSIRLPSACCETVGLKTRLGAVPSEGVFPLVPTYDTVGPMARSVADVAQMWSALTGKPIPDPRLDGLTIGLLTRPPSGGDGTPMPESLAAEEHVAGLERLGARVVPSAFPEPPGNTWPLFSFEAARSHRDTFPSRADEYGDVIRAKLEAAQRASPDAVTAAYDAIAEWRRYVPEVDLYVSPCYAIDLPAEDVDEREVRGALIAFLTWVNVIGWAGLAIGNMQLVAPTDEVVLAAGLAWERG